MEKESEVIVNQIDGYKETFTAVAYRVARLFFVLVQIMNVDPMYQYSLKFYKGIYLRALENGMAAYKGNRNERKTFYVKEFTKLLYEGICRSLFEKDKLLFSMLICFKIMDEVGNLDQREVRFIMTGGTSVEMKRPNPTGA
jgi:dynein heavy chain